MVTTELQRDSWADYFHSVRRRKVLATVRLLGDELDIDNAGAPTCQPLRAISYDAAGDVLELAVGGVGTQRPALRYFVSSPHRITVTETNGARAILVDDRSGQQTFIGLFDIWAGERATSEDHRR